MSELETIYEGDEYANARTRVVGEVYDDAPGGGCHRYRVIFEKTDVSVPETGDRGSVWIDFQKGPVKEVGINGVQDEGLLAVLIDRLERFQAGPFKYNENAEALLKLQEAQFWVESRKQRRMKRGVEGTSQV